MHGRRIAFWTLIGALCVLTTAWAANTRFPTSTNGHPVIGILGPTGDPTPVGTGGTGISLPVTFGAGSATFGGVTDSGPSWTVSQGIAGVAFTSADQSGSAAAVTSLPTSGKKLIITDLVLSTDTAMSFSLTEETSGTLLWKVFLPANGSIQITPRSPWTLATADKRLMLQTGAAGNVAATVSYHSTP